MREIFFENLHFFKILHFESFLQSSSWRCLEYKRDNFATMLENVSCTNNGAEEFNGAWNKFTPTNASLWCICDGFLREEGLVHKKVPGARVNAVDPLAP